MFRTGQLILRTKEQRQKHDFNGFRPQLLRRTPDRTVLAVPDKSGGFARAQQDETVLTVVDEDLGARVAHIDFTVIQGPQQGENRD